MLNIDEIGDVHNRIDQLVDYFHKGNKAAFGRGADIQSGVLAGIIGGRKNKPSFDVLQKLLTAYPSVNPTWLLFGRGPMIQGEDAGVAEATQVALPAKELEDMVYQLVKNQLDERARRAGFSLDKYKDELEQQLKLLSSDIETNKSMLEPSVTERIRGTLVGGEWFEDKITDELLVMEIRRYEKEAELVRSQLNEHARADERIRQEMRVAVYRLAGEPDYDKPFDGLLSRRLGIPSGVAEKLVVIGKIRSVKIEDEGYLVTEQAVREFLGEA